jgi:hypothetical protein
MRDKLARCTESEVRDLVQVARLPEVKQAIRDEIEYRMTEEV